MSESILNNPRIKNLINKGRSKGFLTYKELMSAIPDAENNVELLDAVYTELLDEKIAIIEDAEVEMVTDKELKDLEQELKDTNLQASLDKAITGDPVRMYLREIGRVNLLTAAEEVSLAQMVEAHRYEEAVDAMTKEKRKTTPKKVAEFMKIEINGSALIKEYKSQYEALKKDHKLFKTRKAKEKLTNSNLRLVVSIAKRYMNRGLTFSDLIQEGNIGLMKAVIKFDWRKGYKFSTYATWWIRQAITRAIADQARTIRIPVHMIETINKLRRIQRELGQKYQREATSAEIGKEMELSAERIEEIINLAQEPSSLQTKVGKDGDTELAEFIEDSTSDSPEEQASYELLKDHVDAVLDTLNERERKVLELRFGLMDHKPRTLEEVGKVFGVTRERIRQIEAKALKKLRHPSRSRKLKDYLE